MAQKSMVIREGLEPSIPRLRGSCSNQLSYRTELFKLYHNSSKNKTLTCFDLLSDPLLPILKLQITTLRHQKPKTKKSQKLQNSKVNPKLR